MREIGAFIWYQKLPFDRLIQKWSGHTPLSVYITRKYVYIEGRQII